MKILCETTGSFMLADPNGQVVMSHRPSVVDRSDFVNTRMGLGQVRFIANLTDEATDDEFEKYLVESEGDMALATAAFIESFTAEEKVSAKVDAPKPATRPRNK